MKYDKTDHVTIDISTYGLKSGVATNTVLTLHLHNDVTGLGFAPGGGRDGVLVCNIISLKKSATCSIRISLLTANPVTLM
jgi:hypothetical protein